jgi:hypothetical protein
MSVNCKLFVGGYTIDPAQPDLCQVCGRHSDEHESVATPAVVPPPLAFREGFLAMALLAGDRDALTQLDYMRPEVDPPPLGLSINEVIALGARRVRVIGLCRHRFDRVAVRNVDTNRLSYIRRQVLLNAKRAAPPQKG